MAFAPTGFRGRCLEQPQRRQSPSGLWRTEPGYVAAMARPLGAPSGVGAAPVGAGLAKTRGAALGAGANYCIQRCNAVIGLLALLGNMMLRLEAAGYGHGLLSRTTGLVTRARSLVQLQGLVSRPAVGGHAHRL